MPRSLYRCLLVIVCSFSAGCAQTTIRQHTDLAEHLREIDSVVIAPPAVTIEYVVFNGENDHLREKEAKLKDALRAVAEKELEAHGFEVIDFDFNKAIEEDETFAFQVERVKTEFDFLRRDLYASTTVSKDNMSSFQASIGSAANTVSEMTGADAVMLIHYYGFQKSSGVIAKDMTIAVVVGVLTGVVMAPPVSGSMVEIVMIDGVTGDVLWTNVRGGLQVDELIASQALETFPDDVDPQETPSPDETSEIEGSVSR